MAGDETTQGAKVGANPASGASRQRKPTQRALADRAVLVLPVDKIDVPDDRLRALKPEQAAAIGRAVKADRQYDPITVRMRVGTDRFWLVDGLHRLEGHRLEGLPTIEARMGDADAGKARLQEILSGWVRADHDVFDRAAQLQELVNIAKVPPGSGEKETVAMIATGLRWDLQLAEVLGISPRSVRNYITVGKGFSEPARQVLRRLKLADELVPLMRLAALPPEDFDSVISSLAEGGTATIAEAMALLVPEKAPAWEKSTAKLMKKVADWPSMYRKRLIDELLTKYDRYGNDKTAKGAAE